jgi:hypothetical protein
MAETYDVTLPVLVAVSQRENAIYWRQNSGLFFSLDGKRHIRSTSIKGIPDIMGVERGYPVGIETKAKKGKQGETQRIFQRNFEKSGGIYIIARSPEQALAELDKLPWP